MNLIKTQQKINEMNTSAENKNTANRSWVYYKEYYKPDNRDSILSINNKVLNSYIVNIPNVYTNSDQQIDLVTLYPGLLIGSGYTHEFKNNNQAFKLGFFFDHITGMPIIPGSSVKGLLRSLFPQRVISSKKNEISNKSEKTDWIASILKIKEVNKDKKSNIVDKLEKEIFDGGRWEEKKNKYAPIPLYQRDIFFDAIPVKIVNPNKGIYNKSKALLGEDYITPHFNEKNPRLSGLTEPQPLKFLKIMPQVQIRFRFKLTDTILDDVIITKDDKLVLFKTIISTIGIGAKTNVGYGQFEEV